MEARASIIDVVKSYINTILDSVSGIKALILDTETMNVVSLLFPKSVMLAHEVFLMELITNLPEYPMPYMKGIFLLRATKMNKTHLIKHLQIPKFSEYHLYFTNIPVEMQMQSILQELAANDAKSVVRSVQEFYADFCVLNKELFSLDLPSVISLEKSRDRWTGLDIGLFNRMIEGLLAVLLGTRKHPVIRYQRSSELCNRLARELTVILLNHFIGQDKNGSRTI
jgi:vacuolar protein sorting-associated protein 45